MSDVCITFPETLTATKVNIFTLFNNTGNFDDVSHSIADIFLDNVAELQIALFEVNFGFDVRRYEDYKKSEYDRYDQPFILNQLILTSDSGNATTLISEVLARLH